MPNRINSTPQLQQKTAKMRYWWVNQNQTYRQEISGGYLWSPKRNANNHRNAFYEYMREVSPGDVVFSYCDTKISVIGTILSYCRENPKPEEFGSTGLNWSRIGWKVDVKWVMLENRSIRPKDHIAEIRPLLANKYAPLTKDGNGLQGIYLTTISYELADFLLRAVGEIGNQIRDISVAIEANLVKENPAVEADIIEWENRIESKISTDLTLGQTMREQLIKARVGQGDFRKNVKEVEKRCRITGVERNEHLVASHIRPWRDCDSAEQRLDGENGLLLTPTVDHLFDKGFISFEDNGRLIISPVTDLKSLARMHIATKEPLFVGEFSEIQRRNLNFHREHILRRADVRY